METSFFKSDFSQFNYCSFSCIIAICPFKYFILLNLVGQKSHFLINQPHFFSQIKEKSAMGPFPLFVEKGPNKGESRHFS